jgi:seryl-tRNA synthetase
MKRLRPYLVAVALTSLSLESRAEISQEEYRQMQTRFQQAEEDVDRLRARVQKLESAIAEIRTSLGEVRGVASNAGKDGVSQDQLKKVVDQIRELDKRRQEDNDRIVMQLKKLADIPAPQLPTDLEKPDRKPGGTKSRAKEAAPSGAGESGTGSTNAAAGEPKPLLPPNYAFFEHTVEEGQTLGEIITEYNKAHGMKVRLKHIQEANPKLNPNRMVVGKKIRIPEVK